MDGNHNESGFFVDIMDLLYYIKKKLWIISAVAILCTVVAFLISTLILKPEYTASTRVYVLNQSKESGIVMSDFQISSQMLNDYKVLITGRNVTQEVIEHLGLKRSASALAKQISVTAPANTRVLQISVRDENPELAANIANCVQTIASSQITEIMGVDSVRLIYAAEVPTAPSSPNVSQNAIKGGLLGVIISTVLCVCIYLLDDTIRTEDDVMKYMELSTLGAIPISDQLNRDVRSVNRRKPVERQYRPQR